jgi:hypothetical protein
MNVKFHFHSLFNDAVNSLDNTVNNELGRTWKEAVVA